MVIRTQIISDRLKKTWQPREFAYPEWAATLECWRYVLAQHKDCDIITYLRRKDSFHITLKCLHLGVRLQKKKKREQWKNKKH